VQHLLTERLIREIFDNPEFTRRNAIAVEIEKVIAALTSKSFDRHVFLKSLDRFYVAIESAARTISEWSDKQHFLNTVYERFFQGYSVKLADTMGIVYTPQPIVDFMCASVAEVLEKEFGKSLGDKDVNILDPCTGTGNFIVNLIRRIPKKDLKRVYSRQLFANEIMLLPYYIAALNIEHAYYEQTGEYEPFDGLCFVDTLDLAEARQAQLGFMTEKNTERVERQKRTPITVIIGNPPYNADQQSENDNNPNRAYAVIDQRVRERYTARSTASNKNKMIDPYIRFFRWASDRIGDGDGLIVFITNNNFVHGKPFDGIRLAMQEEFQQIYHLDLNGDVRMNPKLSGTAHNVFGIQVGVGITLAMRRRAKRSHKLNYFRAPEFARKEEKLALLASKGSVYDVNWRTLSPSSTGDWIQFAHTNEFSKLLPVASQHAKRGISAGVVFSTFSVGNKSNRDDVVYDFGMVSLELRINELADLYNSDVDRLRRTETAVDLDEFVKYDRIKWSDGLKAQLRRGKYLEPKAENYRESLWRPFTKKHLFFDRMLNDRRYLIPQFVPDAKAESENKLICVTGHLQVPFQVLVCRDVPSEAIGGRQGQCFPFYVYDADGSNRRENITDWALDQFRTRYQDKKIGKWDIFHYVYGLLHHPGYRNKFADNLKRELPRIPFAPDFRAFAKAGEKLAKLHLDYETLEPWKLRWMETPGEPLSYRVEKMKLSKDKSTLTVNKSLALGDIPPETSEYRLGNRSALEWVVDQYQVSEDKRSGIKSDPNREDDEEYIVRLVGQVVRVSVETVKIVKGLPEAFA
jgi:predicted helicase